MPIRSRFDNGTYAIYTVPTVASTDNAPHTDPLAHLGRLHFHSDLDYPAVVTEWTGSVVVPSAPQNTMVNRQHTLFAHGRTGTPMVLGKCTNFMGRTMPLAGLVPMHPNNAPSSGNVWLNNFLRWFGLASDATNVYLVEYGPVRGSSIGGGFPGATWPSITLSLVIYVTNFDITGAVPGAEPGRPDMRIDPAADDVQFGAGKFDALRRYMRRVTSGDMSLPASATIGLTGYCQIEYELAGHWVFSGYTTPPTSASFTSTATAISL